MSEHLWLQITSGRGPAECQLAVAKLALVLQKEAAKRGLICEALETVEGGARGALLSALLSVEGEGASDFALKNRGSVLWVCRSSLRPTHKRKNWFVGVEALAPLDTSDTALRVSDVTFEAMRASGPGGQHVNKTESAVRATHRPTGFVTTAREERSQVMNKKLALARLAGLLAAGETAARVDAGHDRWAHHDALERGRPVRIFEGAAFKERR